MVAYTATWKPPAYQQDWAHASPIGSLGRVRLVGDVQTYWEQIYPDPTFGTVYDAFGFDYRDRLIEDPPLAVLQVGDCSDEEADTLAILHRRFDLTKQWVADYGMALKAPWYFVMGNHDIVGYPTRPKFIDAHGWANYFGYPAPYYPIEFPNFRILVLGPTGTGEEMTPLAPGGVPVRPMTDADLAWLNTQLTAHVKPTLLCAHAPIHGMSTIGDNPDWRSGQSTVSGGALARDLVEIIDSHHHVAAWMNGHTHSRWNAAPNNVSTFNTGSRQIVTIDAGPMFQRPRFHDRTPAVSFDVNLLDDARTIEVRWRDHEHSLWSSADGKRRVWVESAT